MTNPSSIYLSTVLLEKNRWRSREPSLKVSDWAQPIVDAGFDGIELWENHLLKADRDEWQAVADSPLSVPILNAYCDFSDASADAMAASAELARFLNVSGVKFNFGNDRDQIESYRKNLLAWKNELPEGCRLLCEVHPYTVLEELDNAQEILAPIMDEIEVIVHAFGGDDPSDLAKQIDVFGESITHVHAVLTDKDHAPERIEMLRKAGFCGTWSIEFCYGVREKVEDITQLLSTATEDLNYLRKELA